MAIIGSLGDIYFTVSQEMVQTISNMTWESGASFGEHAKHLDETLVEFTGNEAENISFDMFLSAFLGVNPMAQITQLLKYKREGRTLPLYIGTKGYGKYRWVIDKLKFDMQQYDNKGNLLIAKASITLKSYASR